MVANRHRKLKDRGKNASVRIIGGLFKGRNLQFPEVEGLRPSLGRTRETLFNWLQPTIAGSRCLDLFAGSGALGFEALSRGAAHATLVERDMRASQALSANAAILKLDAAQCRIVHDDANAFLNSATAEPFDLIFLDPPFAQDALPTLLQTILTQNLLASDGMIYYETTAAVTLEHPGFHQYRNSRAGNYQYGLLTPLPER